MRCALTAFTVIVSPQEETCLNHRDPPAPQFIAPPEDPALGILRQQSENQNIRAMQSQATMDTTHLMQQYGIMSALNGVVGAGTLATAAPAVQAAVTMGSMGLTMNQKQAA